jgi:hypothetical protein
MIAKARALPLVIILVFFQALPLRLAAQHFSIGLKTGADAFDPIDTSSAYHKTINHFVVGATLEIPIHDSVAVQMSVLNTRFAYETTLSLDAPSTDLGVPDSFVFVREFQTLNTKVHSWEIPIVVKHYVGGSRTVRPFAGIGGSMRFMNANTHVAGIQEYRLPTPPGNRFSARTFDSTQDPLELSTPWSAGLVFVAGVDWKLKFIHVQPEVQFTRWVNRQLRSPDPALSSNSNGLKVLLNVSFTR